MTLKTKSISRRFGGIIALRDVSAEFRPGQVTALIGENGAGKSTLFNIISGFVPPDSGEVILVGDSEVRLDGMKPHAIARRGVGRLFQEIRVFQQLTVRENLVVAAQSQPREHPLRALLRLKGSRDREQEINHLAEEALAFVGLSSKATAWAETLSFGQQKLVALARLLVADAKVLLLDEPTSGLHPDRIDGFLDLVRTLATDRQRTVVLIEHNLDVVSRVADRVYRLERGELTGAGTPQEILGAAFVRRNG